MPDKRPLTDNEGALLSLVLRQQPITGYQIGKFFESSPVHTFNTSKGKLYPMIHRLEERGLLAAEEVPTINAARIASPARRLAGKCCAPGCCRCAPSTSCSTIRCARRRRRSTC
jgi:hypothetical protein